MSRRAVPMSAVKDVHSFPKEAVPQQIWELYQLWKTKNKAHTSKDQQIEAQTIASNESKR